MLVVTPKHTPRDLEHWSMCERIDDIESRRLGRKLDRMIASALDEMRGFIADERGYLGISWGKDSVVCAWLLWQLQREGVSYPSVWVRVKDWENPECTLVRDAFMKSFPIDRYEEIVVDAGDRHGGTLNAGFKEASDRHGDRHVSGVRSEESPVRRASIGHLGLTTKRTCRPIGRWRTSEVFALSYRESLPLHPAYGYTMGGEFDRLRLRTASIGGTRGVGHGRRGWELAYYPEVFKAAGAK